MTDIYMSYDNLKRTGQFRNAQVESGFGTVCVTSHTAGGGKKRGEEGKKGGRLAEIIVVAWCYFPLFM